MVSAAICRGPGGAAINFSDWAAGMALATTDGVTAAAAPTKPAPLRKLRRLALGQRCLDISSSHSFSRILCLKEERQSHAGPCADRKRKHESANRNGSLQ